MNSAYEESIYSIIATFFVSNYYNAIYFAAKNQASGSGESITSVYTQYVRQFIGSLKNDVNSYQHVAKSLCTYYEEHSGRSLVTFNEFEGKILEIFIPKDHLTFFNMRQRERNMCYIVNEIAKSIGICIIQPGQIGGVIDARSDQHLIEKLKSYGQTSLRLLRDTLHAKYAESSINKGSNSLQHDQIKRVQKMFEVVAKEKCELAAENNKLKVDLTKALEYIRHLKLAYENISRQNASIHARENAKPKRAPSPPIKENYGRAPSPPIKENYGRAPSPPPAENFDIDRAPSPPPAEDLDSLDQLNPVKKEENLWENAFDMDEEIIS